MQQLRSEVTVALANTYGQRITGTPEPSQIDRITGSYSNPTIEMLHESIGTDYAKPVLRLARDGRFDNHLLRACIRLMPEHDNFARWTLHGYFKELFHYRRYRDTNQYTVDKLERFAELAADYTESTGRPLPEASENEQRVIHFLQQRPDLSKVLFDRLTTTTATTVNQDFLDELAAAPAPNLSEGIL